MVQEHDEALQVMAEEHLSDQAMAETEIEALRLARELPYRVMLGTTVRALAATGPTPPRTRRAHTARRRWHAQRALRCYAASLRAARDPALVGDVGVFGDAALPNKPLSFFMAGDAGAASFEAPAAAPPKRPLTAGARLPYAASTDAALQFAAPYAAPFLFFFARFGSGCFCSPLPASSASRLSFLPARLPPSLVQCLPVAQHSPAQRSRQSVKPFVVNRTH